MWKNYIKIAVRNLFNQKLFGILNFVGLSLGISVAGLLLLYVFDEVTFDKYHQNLDNLYRVILNVDWDGEKHKWANAPNAIGPDSSPDPKKYFRTEKISLRYSFNLLRNLSLSFWVVIAW